MSKQSPELLAAARLNLHLIGRIKLLREVLEEISREIEAARILDSSADSLDPWDVLNLTKKLADIALENTKY